MGVELESQAIAISLEDSIKLDSRHIHAAHCLIWCQIGKIKYGLMQMRSDGLLGFPGGGVEEKSPSFEEISQALDRELIEEINWPNGNIDLSNYVKSHLHVKPTRAGKILITHFFMRQISNEEEFCNIEKNHSEAEYFSDESFGLFRVPLNLTNEKFYRNFSRHAFAGNARDQLIDAINILANDK